MSTLAPRSATVSAPASASALHTAPGRTRIRLWDLPVRVFHWALVIAVATAIVTGELGGSWMTLHGKAGLTIVGLVVFRAVWGIIGSTYARFLHFAPTPGKLAAYLRGRWAGVGHNPLGALSVFALLALLAAQAGTGLFSNDDISFNGPLYGLVNEALASRLTGIHKQLSNVLFGFVALHIVAIAVHVGVKKDKLIKPMVTGWKDVDRGESTRHGGPIAFVVALVIATSAAVAVSGAWPRAAAKPAPPAAAPKPAW